MHFHSHRRRSRVQCAGTALLMITFAFSIPAQTLVNHGDAWRYRKATAANAAPQANWKTVADVSLDGTWLTGNGGFGYADNTTETTLCQTLLTDMKGSYSTVA